MNELQHHAAFSAYLKKQGILHIHARTDQKSGIAVGWPDYSLFLPGGKTLLIEFKQKGKKPTAEQQATIDQLKGLGHDVRVLYDAESAIRYLESIQRSKLATEAATRPKAPAQAKLYLQSSRDVGDLVVSKNGRGEMVFIRVATAADAQTLPRWIFGME